MNEKPFSERMFRPERSSEFALAFPMLSLGIFWILLYLNWGNSLRGKSRDSPKVVSPPSEGFFSLGKVLAIVSVLGIIISLGPALTDLEKILPLQKLSEFLIDYFEFIMYPLALYLIYHGLKSSNSSGMYTSLLGTALVSFAFVADLDIYLGHHFDYTDENMLAIYLYACSHLVPLAIYFQSRLYGLLSIIQLTEIIRLLGLCKIPAQMLGFDDQSTMGVYSIATGTLIGVFVISKVGHVSPSILDPFTTGINTYATFCFLMCLLITALKTYTSPNLIARIINPNIISNGFPAIYWVRQLYFILGVSGILISGHLTDIPRMISLGNVAIAFYLVSKYGEFITYSGLNYIWLHVLFSSCLLFAGSLYLQNRPSLIRRFLCA